MGNETIRLGTYTLTIDTETGGLSGLQRDGGAHVMGHGGTVQPVTTANLSYKPAAEAAPRFLGHTHEDDTLTLSCELGPLHLHDVFTAVPAEGLLERRIRVENASQAEVQLTSVRLTLPGAAIGDPADCLFEAPATTVRPRTPLRHAASQPPPPPTLFSQPHPGYDREFAPGAPRMFAAGISDAPDMSPGLLIVHNPTEALSLMTWYVSRVESGRAWVAGDDMSPAVTLGLDIWLAGWLAPGESLEAGTQYIVVQPGTYAQALTRYRELLPYTGIMPPIYDEIDTAADWSAVYEVHPGQFGGFEGLRQALPGLAAMGIDTLYLLPIHAHRNKRNAPWDENWEGVGSPYAIHDFYALEPSLGTEEDFQRLVDAAHSHNMRVLMDLVLQGSSLEARYVQEHPEWYARDENGQMVHSHGWNDTWSFDWANPDYQTFVLGYARHYVEKFGIDGYRVDAPHGKEPNWDRALAYHASGTNLGTDKLLADLRRLLSEIKPGSALYCELFGPMWITSHDISNDYHPYAMALQLYEGTLTPAEFNTYLRDYWAVMPRAADGTPSPRICFVETHDTRAWPTYALRGSAISRALLAILAAGGFTPMIFAGQEQGQADFLRGLFHARREHPVLRRGELLVNAVTIDDENHYRRNHGDPVSERVHALIRHDADSVLLSVVSLLPEKATFRLGLPVDDLPIDPDGTYRLVDALTGEAWDEFGQTTWQGRELASFRLSLPMYVPHFLLVTPV